MNRHTAPRTLLRVTQRACDASPELRRRHGRLWLHIVERRGAALVAAEAHARVVVLTLEKDVLQDSLGLPVKHIDAGLTGECFAAGDARNRPAPLLGSPPQVLCHTCLAGHMFALAEPPGLGGGDVVA